MKHSFLTLVLISLITFFAKGQTYTLEYVSGANQTYCGGGMPEPMVFKIKNSAGAYVNNITAEGLSFDVTSTQEGGKYDGQFNNLNNYCKNGDANCFGGYYYVPSNSGKGTYTLALTVVLKKGSAKVAEYKANQNISTCGVANKYKVISATWAVGTKKADVTKRVQELADGGAASFEARNHILNADPAAGERKTLTVVYTVNGGAQITKSCMEREFFKW